MLRPSSGGAQMCFTHNVLMERFTPTPNDIGKTFKVRIDWFLQTEETFASSAYIVQKSWNHVKIDQKLVDLTWEITPFKDLQPLTFVYRHKVTGSYQKFKMIRWRNS